MRKISVDSDYVIDYLRGLAYTKNLIEKVKLKELEAYISVVTVFELRVGALLSNNPGKKLEDVEKLLDWFHIVDITKEIMSIASKIHVNLRKKGITIGIEDILIAATAISLNMGLITNNKKHFKNIEDLRLDN